MAIKARRSLTATPAGIRRANRAVMVFATKIDLAAELEISRATVQNFFAGKPIGRENFHKICQTLKLPWHEIADLSEDEDLDAIESPSVKLIEPDVDARCSQKGSDFADLNPAHAPVEIAAQQDWIPLLKQQLDRRIQQQCAHVRVLDMSQPRPLNLLYTEVKVLEKMAHRRRLSIPDLIEQAGSDGDFPLLNAPAQPSRSGMNAVAQHPKLIVLGKPGAGKTTFLKHIAMQCIEGAFLADYVPIFISLRDFANQQPQLGLFNYVSDQLSTANVAEPRVLRALLQGKTLVLLDGLDEVRQVDRATVLQAIEQFVTQFHANRFVMTCRIAAQDYLFEQFTEVEIADFDQMQITTFAANWFAQEPAAAARFLQMLHVDRAWLELASSPMLLTLLCLIVEECGSLPAKRSTLYKEALEILLKTWDAKRQINRTPVYRNLCLRQKEELLSQIALLTFERQYHFFPQKEVERFIGSYSDRIAPIQQEFSSFGLDSEAVLKSIEAQHGLLVERARGIYSFLFVGFQQYLAARAIAAAECPAIAAFFLKKLIDQTPNQGWREVFLLVMEMLPNPDRLIELMQKTLREHDPELCAVLNRLQHKPEGIAPRSALTQLQSQTQDSHNSHTAWSIVSVRSTVIEPNQDSRKSLRNFPKS